MSPQPAQLSSRQYWEVLLVSAEPDLLERLKQEITKIQFLHLSTEFTNPQQAQQYLKQVAPDLVIIDHPQQEQFLRQLKWQFPTLVSATVGRQSLYADFCFHKTQPIQPQLQQLFHQQKQLTFSIKGSSLYHHLCQQLLLNAKELSAKEIELLSLLSYGHDYQQVAQTLNLSSGTVQKYLFHLREKVNARDTAHLLCIGFRGGLIY